LKAEAQIAREKDVWMVKGVCSALVELELKKAREKLVICKLDFLLNLLGKTLNNTSLFGKAFTIWAKEKLRYLTQFINSSCSIIDKKNSKL
jgi:hypothetical protein